MDQDYLDDAALAVGRLMGTFWSLEWMLRNVLYRLAHQPHAEMPRPRPLFAANVGDRFPLNALTSYDSLRQLIATYNKTAPTRLDPSIVDVRDTLAHSRVLCADETWVNLSLVKFSKPVNGQVTLETRYELTRDWLNKQIERIETAVAAVTAQYRALGGA